MRNGAPNPRTALGSSRRGRFGGANGGNADVSGKEQAFNAFKTGNDALYEDEARKHGQREAQRSVCVTRVQTN